MFLANLKHNRTIDLFSLCSNYPKLTHSTDYSLCHTLGRYAVDHSIGLYLTPSARKTDGKCVPVFLKEAVQGDAYQYDYYLNFEENSRSVLIERKGKYSQFEVPLQW